MEDDDAQYRKRERGLEDDQIDSRMGGEASCYEDSVQNGIHLKMHVNLYRHVEIIAESY